MTDRICSCCGQPYTESDGHDYEKCVGDCQRRVDNARHNLNDALDCWRMAYERREAQRVGRMK